LEISIKGVIMAFDPFLTGFGLGIVATFIFEIIAALIAFWLVDSEKPHPASNDAPTIQGRDAFGNRQAGKKYNASLRDELL